MAKGGRGLGAAGLRFTGETQVRADTRLRAGECKQVSAGGERWRSGRLSKAAGRRSPTSSRILALQGPGLHLSQNQSSDKKAQAALLG